MSSNNATTWRWLQFVAETCSSIKTTCCTVCWNTLVSLKFIQNSDITGQYPVNDHTHTHTHTYRKEKKAHINMCVRYGPHVLPTSVLYIFICGDTQKALVYSAATEKEETLQQRIFYSCHTVCNRQGTFEIVRQSIIRLPMWRTFWASAVNCDVNTIRNQQLLSCERVLQYIISAASKIFHSWRIYRRMCPSIKLRNHSFPDIRLYGLFYLFLCEELAPEECPSVLDTPCMCVRACVLLSFSANDQQVACTCFCVYELRTTPRVHVYLH